MKSILAGMLAIAFSFTQSAMASEDYAQQLMQLQQRAQRGETLRLIVQLHLDAALEANLPRAAVTQQRQRIADVRERVWKRLQGKLPAAALAPTTHSIKNYATIPYVALEATPAIFPHLLADPEISAVFEDTLHAPSLAQSVPLIKADNAWSKGIGGAGQVVAILDTGVQLNHEMFSDKIVSQACYSTTSAALGATSLCPGQAASSTATGSGADCPTSIDGCGHGTHVAGIAAGQSANLSGVAKDAKIIAIQVFSRVGNRAQAFASDYIKALERVYALRNDFNIAAVNMSLGGDKYSGHCDSRPAKAIIDQLKAAGIATIVASGNEGYKDGIAEPACISSAISVGATDKNNQVAAFSNSTAEALDLLAPGVSIQSAIAGTAHNGYGIKQGTSMAAPHVTGAWALLKQLDPEKSVDAALNTLQETGVAITDSNNVVTKRIRLDEATSGSIYRVTVGLIGGWGSVTSSPARIDCGLDCRASFGANTALTLTAKAANGSIFKGWSGACSGSHANCQLTVDQAKTVTAEFSGGKYSQPQITLKINTPKNSAATDKVAQKILKNLPWSPCIRSGMTQNHGVMFPKAVTGGDDKLEFELTVKNGGYSKADFDLYFYLLNPSTYSGPEADINRAHILAITGLLSTPPFIQYTTYTTPSSIDPSDVFKSRKTFHAIKNATIKSKMILDADDLKLSQGLWHALVILTNAQTTDHAILAQPAKWGGFDIQPFLLGDPLLSEATCQ